MSSLKARPLTIETPMEDKHDIQAPRLTRVWQKKFMQEVLTKVRQANYRVERTNYGYAVFNDDLSDHSRRCVLRALVGSNGYIVTYREDLFQ